MNFEDSSAPRITDQINILKLKKAKEAKINLHSFKNTTDSLNSILKHLRENRAAAVAVPWEMERIKRWNAERNLPGVNLGSRSALLVILTSEVDTSPCHWTKRQIENIIISEDCRSLENELPKGFTSVTLTFELSLSIVR